MKFAQYWLGVVFLLAVCQPNRGLARGTFVVADTTFFLDWQLSPLQAFPLIAGDYISTVLVVGGGSDRPNDSTELRVAASPGIKLSDPLWTVSGAEFIRKIPPIPVGDSLTLALQLQLLPTFKGQQLSLGLEAKKVTTDNTTNAPGVQAGLTLEVAKIMAVELDTCVQVQDTAGNMISSLIATRRKVRAGFISPIELSPAGIFRASGKSCSAFKLKQPKKKKKKKKKEKCSCFTYRFAGRESPQYPLVETLAGEKVDSCKSYSIAGQQGDTISLSLRTVDGKPLKRIMLLDGKGEVLDAVYDSPVFSFQDTLSNDTATFRLLLQYKKILGIIPRKQLVIMESARRPKAFEFYRDAGPPLFQPDGDTLILSQRTIDSTSTQKVVASTIVARNDEGAELIRLRTKVDSSGMILEELVVGRDTCDGQFAYRSIPQREATYPLVAIDTLITEIVSKEIQVVGKRNLFGLQRAVIEVEVPLALDLLEWPARDRLIHIAYWIGIGEMPINAYTALEGEIKAELPPGVSPPLAVYGERGIFELPGLFPGEEIFQKDNVRYDFVGEAQLSRAMSNKPFSPLIKRTAKRPNYGLVSAGALRSLLSRPYNNEALGKEVWRFWLFAGNVHEINTFRLQLKIIGFYEVREPQLKWTTVNATSE